MIILRSRADVLGVREGDHRRSMVGQSLGSDLRAMQPLPDGLRRHSQVRELSRRGALPVEVPWTGLSCGAEVGE